MLDKIHIVLDSVSSAMGSALEQEPRLHIMKLLVSHGDQEWRDGDRPLQFMLDLVEKSGVLPRTSQPPLGEMLELFRSLSQEGIKLLVLTMAGGLSGTYQSACQAAREVMAQVPGADIRVVDSKTAAHPIRGIAARLLAATAAGMGLDEAEGLARDLVARTDTYFTISSLEFLQKGGRIGRASALIGSILGIKPILHLDLEDGTVRPYDKCRTKKKVLQRMTECGAQHAPLEALYVGYATLAEDAKVIADGLAQLFPEVPLDFGPISTSVLDAHLGPSVIGVWATHKA